MWVIMYHYLCNVLDWCIGRRDFDIMINALDKSGAELTTLLSESEVNSDRGDMAPTERSACMISSDANLTWTLIPAN